MSHCISLITCVKKSSDYSNCSGLYMALVEDITFFFIIFLTIFICIHDMIFTKLRTINITYNTQSTNHNDYSYIVNNTNYTYKTKRAYNVHTSYRNNAMSFSEHFFSFLLTKRYFTSNTIFTNFTVIPYKMIKLESNC